METNGVGPINTENWWELFEGEEGFVDPETALILADLRQSRGGGLKADKYREGKLSVVADPEAAPHKSVRRTRRRGNHSGHHARARRMGVRWSELLSRFGDSALNRLSCCGA